MIAGLPRSGSTLLSSILKQNPRFSAAISDPLNEVLISAIHAFSGAGVSTQCSEQRRINVLRGIIESYYADDDREVVFNTSRFWTSHLSLMHLLYPNAKVICCVRDIGWILDSFEKLYRNNPTIYSKNMYGPVSNDFYTDHLYTRADNFMSEGGATYKSLSSLRTGYFSEHNNKMLFVEYRDLASNPEDTMRRVYQFIDEPYYKHDFNNVEVSYDEYDEAVQVKGLHKTRKKVQYLERNTIIPPDIWERYKGLEFWRE